MKRTITLLTLSLALGFSSCGDDYDDTDLWNKVNDHEERLAALEQWQAETNNNIAALQTLLNTTDYITSVTPVMEGGKEVGYTITFLNSDPITIYHGTQGEAGADGTTPQIGLEKGDDGNWYWTLNGELMTDSEGNPIRANGEDGKDGQDGQDGEDGEDGEDGGRGPQGPQGPAGKDAIAPQVRINETSDEWEISTDGGNTWTSTGVKATGERGESLFEDIDTDNPNYVTFTLTAGGSFQVPRYQSIQILTEAEHNGNSSDNNIVYITEATTFYLKMNEGMTYKNIVAYITPLDDDAVLTRADGWVVAVQQSGEDITISVTPSITGKALLDVSLIRSDGSKVTASRVLWAVSEVTGDKITAAGDYLLTGSRSSTLTIEGEGINLILDDAKVNVTNGNAITVSSGSPTITVVGTGNEVESSNGVGIFIAQGNTVTIEGNGTDDALTVEGRQGGAGIGGSAYTPCGNIIIDNIIVTARSEGQAGGGIFAAGIGTSSSSVGKISISNAIIYAYAAGDGINMGAAAIGSGIDSNAGTTIQREFDITISNSTIYASKGCSYASYIGAGGDLVNPTGYTIISTAKITNSTIYNESGAEITQ